jgi:hypothetical protein
MKLTSWPGAALCALAMMLERRPHFDPAQIARHRWLPLRQRLTFYQLVSNLSTSR